jgi:tetratricopeptide (TPR) repeat protein
LIVGIQQNSRAQSTKKLLKEAQKDYDNKLYQEAILKLNDVIKLEPQNDDALALRGQTFKATQAYENAISDLFSSIDLGHNELYMQRGCQVKEMLYLFNKVKGVVTNNIVAESLCLYLGIDALTLLTKKDSWPHYEFFKFRPQRILIKKEEQTIEHFVYDEVRILKDFNQVIDQIHFNFKL